MAFEQQLNRPQMSREDKQARLHELYDKYIEQYGDLIANTGGNDLFRLLDGETNILTNMPLAVLEVAVQNQFQLLSRLDRAGLLRPREQQESVNPEGYQC